MGTQTLERTAAGSGVRRGLGIGAAVAMVLAAILPWVTVTGRLPLDLDPLGLRVTAGGMTVKGLDTVAGPYLLGVAVVVGLLAALGIARRLLLTLGVLTMAAAGGLLYYLSNVVDIETAERNAVERAAADLLVGASVGPGAWVLLAAGGGIVLAALAPTRRSGGRA